ncbi:MAG: glycosyltransferase [Bacillota bacterium]|jgi:glycosyltransferase involved in cell wall biosynthesis
MRVLHVITDTNIGGAGRYLMNLLTQFASMDIEASVVCPEGELAKRLDGLGIARMTTSGKDVSFSLPLTFEFMRLFRKAKPDLVHTHSSLSARIAAKFLGIPVVYTKHGLDGAVSPLGILINNLVSKVLSDGIIAVSSSVEKGLVQSGVDPSRIACILNGIDLEQFLVKETRKADDFGKSGKVVVGTAARLHPVKALDILVDAAKIVLDSLPNVRFVIGGTGPMEGTLKKKIEDMGLEPYVKMVGFVEDVPGFLHGLDVFVLCSDSEGLGLAALEAMAAGLPVVATAVGGVPEAVKDRETGLLVPPQNRNLLARAIMSLVIQPETAVRMGVLGRRRVEQLFDAKVMAKKTLDLYRRVLESRRFFAKA